MQLRADGSSQARPLLWPLQPHSADPGIISGNHHSSVLGNTLLRSRRPAASLAGINSILCLSHLQGSTAGFHSFPATGIHPHSCISIPTFSQPDWNGTNTLNKGAAPAAQPGLGVSLRGLVAML